jgi:hypothetical protein
MQVVGEEDLCVCHLCLHQRHVAFIEELQIATFTNEYNNYNEEKNDGDKDEAREIERNMSFGDNG